MQKTTWRTAVLDVISGQENTLENRCRFFMRNSTKPSVEIGIRYLPGFAVGMADGLGIDHSLLPALAVPVTYDLVKVGLHRKFNKFLQRVFDSEEGVQFRRSANPGVVKYMNWRIGNNPGYVRRGFSAGFITAATYGAGYTIGSMLR